MTKKEIINTLREMGFKANCKNVLISTYEEKGYITVIQNKTEMYIVTKEMIENRIELLNSRKKDNQKIIAKLQRKIRKMEKEGK